MDLSSNEAAQKIYVKVSSMDRHFMKLTGNTLPFKFYQVLILLFLTRNISIQSIDRTFPKFDIN